MNHDSTNPPMHRSATRFRASQLIDCKITNARGDSLGGVQDIVLANDNRSIAYVVVGFGGFLGMGEKFFAMPWRLIKATRSTMDTEPRMTLNVDQEVLEAAPGFDKDKWPDMADKTWSRQVDDFYSTRGLPADAGTMSRTSGTPLTDTRTGNSYGRDPNSSWMRNAPRSRERP
jgi:sporulation protein YlmC with PRC-barrel domain